MIKFVSDFRHVGGFLQVLRFPPTNKTHHHDITEILLKVALNTINQPKPLIFRTGTLSTIYKYHTEMREVRDNRNNDF
jgi:hypothetical protein